MRREKEQSRAPETQDRLALWGQPVIRINLDLKETRFTRYARLRRKAPRPSRAEPSSTNVAGSGTPDDCVWMNWLAM